jgi:hypothetical protein
MATRQNHPKGHDEALPFLSAAEATRFRDLVKKAWAKAGREITMFPDHAEGDNGCVIGFWNLAADCHKYPQRMWPRIIAEHVRLGLIDPNQDFFEGMSRKEVLRHTYVRLFAKEGLPDPSWYPYAREVVPGVVELIALHRRRSSFFYREEDVERFGGLDVLREAGLANLRILPAEHRERIETPQGGHFRVLLDPSSFTSSRVLTLERLASVLYTEADMPHGVLAAIPNRNEVAIHIIRDDSAVPTLVNLATFAHLRIASAPGPLSPNVYWLDQNRFEQVLTWDKRGRPELSCSAEFKDMMDDLLRSASTGSKTKPWAM